MDRLDVPGRTVYLGPPGSSGQGSGNTMLRSFSNRQIDE